MLFFVFFLVTRHIKSSVTLCQKKYNVKSEKYTDFFKTFNHSRNPDLIQHQNHPKIHLCSSVLDRTTGSSSHREKIPTANITKQ